MSDSKMKYKDTLITTSIVTALIITTLTFVSVAIIGTSGDSEVKAALITAIGTVVAAVAAVTLGASYYHQITIHAKVSGDYDPEGRKTTLAGEVKIEGEESDGDQS